MSAYLWEQWLGAVMTDPTHTSMGEGCTQTGVNLYVILLSIYQTTE